MKQQTNKKRIESMQILPSIAISLGPEKSRAILIPFIWQLLEEDDEVVEKLLEISPNLVNLIGGPSYGHLILSI
jgi:serine/threonine-protein phosphatase 2A regulatory subunit A